MNDYEFMNKALCLARQAADMGEVPVGAVVVKDNIVIGMGHNLRISRKSSLAHAEIIAIENACKTLGDWRLDGCSIYVTLEPCPMCAGAIIESRIDRVVFGAFDFRAGAFDSICNMSAFKFAHRPEITAGIMENECLAVLKSFFESVRN